jgi:signal transduction histidine kinase
MTEALPRRIKVAFLLQVAIASIVIVAGALMLGSVVTEHLVRQALADEVAYFWAQREANPDHPPPRTLAFRGFVVAPGGSAASLPPVYRPLPPGLHLLDAQDQYVYVDERPEGRFYLTYPQQRIQWMAGVLLLGPMLLALVAVIFSAWLTYRMAKRLLAPMGWLAGEVRHWDPRNPDLTRLAADRLPEDADIETRHLAGALHTMGERVRAFVARERDFTRDASHELRTPLTVIRVASDLLIGDPDLPERSRRSLERIQRAGQDMEQVIDAFLILAREADIGQQAEDFNVRDVVMEEVDKLQASAEYRDKSGRVDLEVTGDAGPTLHAPPRVLGVMLGNLLSNAWSFTDAGHVEVAIRRDRVEVRDSGIGMEADRIERVFDPFYRVDPDAGGKGMGLSIVRRLGERFGWPVSIESVPGEGTVATIRFS